MESTPADDRITAKPPMDERIVANHPADDIVRLVTAVNPVQAHIWQQALKEEGIVCRVVGDYLDAAIGDIPGLRAEVWIHRDDLTRAQEILERSKGLLEEGEPEIETDIEN